MISANDPKLQSWIAVPAHSDFPIQNIPFAVAKHENYGVFCATRIGDTVINLQNLAQHGYLDVDAQIFAQDHLNQFIKLGKQGTRAIREQLSQLFCTSNSQIKKEKNIQDALLPVSSVQLLLPVQIGDYTDFYSSIEHATNVGTMFRDPKNALLPNWRHLPVAYHGRASSIILSGQNIHRPKGQQKLEDAELPVFGPTKRLDFELELAFITFDGKPLGESIATVEADDYIFGMCLFNDWSARDLQTWEYVPLGPFLAKNFASSISPWIVTLDALEPFRVAGPKQEPEVLDYLKFSGNKNIDINLQACILPENCAEEQVVSRTNYKYMYWNMEQQLAHHTVNGCNIRAGDMMASGTISGPTPESYGSMLEIAWKGTKPVTMPDGSKRSFINDGDTVIMRGHCEKNQLRIGFGEVRAKILPSK